MLGVLISFSQGLEDILILDEFLSRQRPLLSLSLGKAFEQFSEHRSVDARAMCDIATYNFTEVMMTFPGAPVQDSTYQQSSFFLQMCELVTRPTFQLRKRLDHALHAVAPDWWTPLYIAVSFTRMRYAEAYRMHHRQNRVSRRKVYVVVCIIVMLVMR